MRLGIRGPMSALSISELANVPQACLPSGRSRVSYDPGCCGRPEGEADPHRAHAIATGRLALQPSTTEGLIQEGKLEAVALTSKRRAEVVIDAGQV